MQLNRVVVLLTPLVFAPLSGFISLKLAELGVNIDTDTVQGAVISGAVFLAGVAVAYAKSRKWLQGWQKWEARQDWIANASLDERFTKFLEELAEKTGTPLPAAEGLPLATVGAGSEELAEQAEPPPAFAPGAMETTPDTTGE